MAHVMIPEEDEDSRMGMDMEEGPAPDEEEVKETQI